MSRTDLIINEIAARQHGLVTRAQLLDARVSSDTVRGRVRARRLRPVQRGVYLAGPLHPPLAKPLSAVLACGPAALFSHAGAGVLWEVIPADRAGTLVDVSVARARGRAPARIPRAPRRPHSG